MSKLQVENEVLEKHLNEWRISHLGEFVLIKGSDVKGFFPTLDAAFNEGLRLFGMDDILVEQIKPTGSVNVTFYGRAI